MPELAANPKAYDGFLEKRPDTQQRTINNVISAYEALKALFPDMKPEELNTQFTEMCEMSIGAVEELYRERRGGTKEKATDTVNKAFSGCLTYVPRSGRILRVKE